MTFLGQVLLPHPLSPSFTAHTALFMQSLAHPRPGWTLPAGAWLLLTLRQLKSHLWEVAIPPSIWLPTAYKWGTGC